MNDTISVRITQATWDRVRERVKETGQKIGAYVDGATQQRLDREKLDGFCVNKIERMTVYWCRACEKKENGENIDHEMFMMRDILNSLQPKGYGKQEVPHA